jgi:hypothetical protein
MKQKLDDASPTVREVCPAALIGGEIEIDIEIEIEMDIDVEIKIEI